VDKDLLFMVPSHRQRNIASGRIKSLFLHTANYTPEPNSEVPGYNISIKCWCVSSFCIFFC